MLDPFGSMQGMVSQLRQFMGNPMQFMLQKKLNIPANMLNNPNQAIQYLMDHGQMNQDQYNQLRSMADQIQNNQQFRQMMGKR